MQTHPPPYPQAPCQASPCKGKGAALGILRGCPHPPTALSTGRPKDSRTTTVEPHLRSKKHGASLARETRLGDLQGEKNQVKNQK